MSDYRRSCNEAVQAFVASVKDEAKRGSVAWRIALFVEDTAGWRTITIDPCGQNDLDAEIIWSANRMARILRAPVAAFADEHRDGGGVVFVERRGATHAEVYRLSPSATSVPKPEKVQMTFEVVPGGDPDEGWGWQDHDSLELDLELPHDEERNG